MLALRSFTFPHNSLQLLLLLLTICQGPFGVHGEPQILSNPLHFYLIILTIFQADLYQLYSIETQMAALNQI